MKKLLAVLTMLLAACSGDKAPDFKAGSYKLVDSLNNVPTTLTFVEDGKFSGHIVNYLMGSYTVGKKGKFTFGETATTMMMGPAEEMEAERNFLDIIPKVTAYKMQGNYLVLITENGGELLFEPYKPANDETTE